VRRGIVERLVQIDCGSPDTCLALLEKIEEELSSHATVFGELRGSKLRIRIIGFETEVQRTLLNLRELVDLFRKRMASPRYGVRAEDLAKMARKSVPLDVLAAILRVQGIAAEVRGSMIYADTDMDTLIAAAKDLGEAMDRVANAPLSYTARKFLAAVIALTKMSPSQAMRKAIELGIINDSGELTAPLEQCIRDFIDAVESEEL